MSITNLARSAFGITIAATVFAGCAGAPLSPAATGRPAFTVARGGGTMRLVDHRRSRIDKPAAAKALLYVTDAGTGSVYVYDYPSGKEVGAITGFGYPQGECTDSAGNIYVVDSGSAQIFEFAYGGTTPIATFSDPNQFPASCAIDPNSGALAVSSIFSPSEFQVGSIAVYPAGSSIPTTYVDPRNAREYFLAYDGSGNIYVDGVDSATNAFRYAKMSPGGKFTEIKIKGAKLTYPAGVQRVGNNMAVGDQDGAVSGTPDVYSVSPNGKVVARSTLSTANGGRIGDLVQFSLDAKAKNVVAPDAIGASVYLNTWPKGGYVSTLATGLVTPIAAVISKPPKK